MPQGLQCWDASGNLVLDVTDRLTRYLGQVQTNSVAGSLVTAAFLTGIPWYCQFKIATDAWTVITNLSPNLVVSISGSTMSWSYTSGDIANPDFIIVYGVY